MNAMNQVTMMGRLTAKPELKFTRSNGFPVCTFFLAVDRPFRKSDDKEKETDFFRIVAWRSVAEFVCKYFDKGDQMLLTGTLRNSKFTVEGEETPRSQTEIVVKEIFFTGYNGQKKNDEMAQDTPNHTLSGVDLAEFEELCADQDVPF